MPRNRCRSAECPPAQPRPPSPARAPCRFLSISGRTQRLPPPVQSRCSARRKGDTLHDGACHNSGQRPAVHPVMTVIARACICRVQRTRSRLRHRSVEPAAHEARRVDAVDLSLLEQTMNTIGLLGGMSWESTAIYYRLINQLARFQRGRLHSAPLLIWSADFEDIRRLQVAGEWYKTAEILAAAACQLERAGARLLLLCTNTMHKVAAEIEAAVSIPLLHLADVTAARIKRAGFQRVGFLGSRYAMEQDFYTGRLTRQHLTVCTPAAADRDMIDHVIFDELCNGVV